MLFRPLRRRSAAATAAVTTLLCFPIPAAAAAEAPGHQVRLIAKANPGQAPAVADRLTEEVAVVGGAADGDVLELVVEDRDADDALAELEADADVAYAEEDVLASVAHVPADPRYADQWSLAHADVPAAWAATLGDERTVIAVVDSGVTRGAADLRGAPFVPGYDAVDGDRNTADPNGHGTQAAGVIAAQHNARGAAGVCPRCAIMPVRVLGEDGSGWHSDIADGIEWAVDHGADIVNLSLGGRASSRRLHDAVRYATRQGALVVAAAGNGGSESPYYPAAYAEALSVAASDARDRRYGWSNAGEWTQLAAPGCNWSIDVARPFCGTSSAAPFVASVAGLLASTRPAASAGDLRAALTTTAADVGFVARGRVAAGPALVAVAGQPPRKPVATLAASARHRRFGERVTITGRVRDGSGGVAGADVAFQRRAAGSSPWVTVARRATGADGRARLSLQPSATADYRLRSAAAASPAVKVAIAHHVSIRGPWRRSVQAGATAELSGVVRPAHPGKPVFLQRLTPHGWQSSGSARLSSRSGYRFAIKPLAAGQIRYRVVLPADRAHGWGASRPVTVTATR